MGLYDRNYTQDNYNGGSYGRPSMRLGFPSLTPVVRWLLIANLAAFLLQAILGRIGHVRVGPYAMDPLSYWFSVFPYRWTYSLQVWRLVTYQFLHGGIFHLMMNMLGLYFLGPTLERHWGGRQFLGYYLGCGTAGGLLYLLMASIGALGVGTLIGASGAILGLLAACAILFPHFVVFIIVFPVPIRTATFIITFIAIAVIISNGFNAGGEAAHLGGMLAGAAYVFSTSWRKEMVGRIQNGAWERKKKQERQMAQDLDAILDKVHNHGIQSLTRGEKQLLKQATELERKQNLKRH